MVYSKGSVVVGDQGSHDWLAGVPVVPDRGSQGEDALQDPDGDARDGAATVLFKVQLALEGLIDRFDGLPHGSEQATARAGRFGAISRSNDSDTAFVEPGFDVTVAVALVHDQDQPVQVVKHMRLQGNQVDEDFAFV